MTGASYGARTNDGVVTDLATPSWLASTCYTRHREQIHGDIPSATTRTTKTTTTRRKPYDPTVIERSLFVYGNQSVSPGRWISFRDAESLRSLDRVHIGEICQETKRNFFPQQNTIGQHYSCKNSYLPKDYFFNHIAS